jgi:hypothetical protein
MGEIEMAKKMEMGRENREGDGDGERRRRR